MNIKAFSRLIRSMSHAAGCLRNSILRGCTKKRASVRILTWLPFLAGGLAILFAMDAIFGNK
jgi:hypothetical protein